MKRFLIRRAFALVMALAVLMAFSPAAFASSGYEVLTLDKTKIKPGESVNLKVTLPTVTDEVGAVTVDLRFDKSKLTVTNMSVAKSIPIGTSGNAVAVMSNNAELANQNGQIAANAYFTHNTLKPSGVVLLDVTLTAKEGASGTATFDFDIFQLTSVDDNTGSTVYVVNKSDLKELPTLTIGEDSSSSKGGTTGGSTSGSTSGSSTGGSSSGSTATDKAGGTKDDGNAGDTGLIAEKDSKAAAVALVKDLSLKARSSKTSKGSIKVSLTVDSDDIKAIEDLGYTVKYKFYRSTKKTSSYKAKTEKTAKTYTNTTGKKGTKYYYKARVMVYDSNGTLVAKSALKQCKYACRVK